MQIKISSKHVQVTEAIESYASKKIEKFPRYFDRVTQVEVVIDKAPQGYKVEIITDVEHHEPFIATCSHEDLYACLDVSIDRSLRQLKDHKSRVRDHKHHNSSGGNTTP